MPHLSPTQPLTLATLATLLHGDEPVRLDPATDQQLAATYASAAAGQSAIPSADAALAEPSAPAPNLLLAYAVGTGPELPAPLVRRMLLLHAYHLGHGQPGVNPALVRRLLDFFNREVWPVVPAQGEVGLLHNQIPLAHLSLPLLGLGEVNYQGYRLAAADVLSLFSWEPLTLQGHEGQALLSGSAFTLAYATEALARTTRLLAAAEAIGALATDVYGATLPPLASSELPAQPWAANSPELATQAFKGMAQVHAAARTTLAQASQGVGDALHMPNDPTPLFSVQEMVAEPQPAGANASLLLGQLAQAVAAVGELSARRVARLVAGEQQLPRYLAPDSAAGFGLLALPQLAASLVGQNQQLALAGSFGASDAGTTGAQAAVASGAPELLRVVENTEQLLGIELLAAAQALELRRSARSSPALEAVVAAFRAVVTFASPDRALAPDLHRAARFVREYEWA